MSSTPLRYDIPDVDLVLELSVSVLEHFTTHKQFGHRSKEAGGQIFANLDEPGILRVIDVSGPRSTDIRSLFGYLPNRRQERAEIAERYKRNLHFVGDWHTHAEYSPNPSATDNASMREMVQRSAHDLPGYILVIVGRAIFPSGLHVSFHRKNGSVHALKAQAEHDAM
jgi:integrative and conjugative element protein (TIGR02256 family)